MSRAAGDVAHATMSSRLRDITKKEKRKLTNDGTRELNGDVSDRPHINQQCFGVQSRRRGGFLFAFIDCLIDVNAICHPRLACPAKNKCVTPRRQLNLHHAACHVHLLKERYPVCGPSFGPEHILATAVHHSDAEVL